MEQIKNILILSTQDPYRSSGVGAYDIFKNLKKNSEYKVQLLVETYNSSYEEGILCIKSYSDNIRSNIKRKVLKRVKIKDKLEINPDYHFHQNKKEYYSTKRILKINKFNPDLIIVFFAQNFITYKNLRELQDLTRAPIIWQFADMRPFTGGCHYAWDCNGYMSSCETCPAFKVEKEKDFPYYQIKNNYEFIKDLNITAVIGSDWLISRAKKSTLFKKKRIEKIFLPLDSSFFKPEDNYNDLKVEYNVSQDKKVLLIAANYLHHKRKGVAKIFEALNILAERDNSIIENIELFIVGHELERIKNEIPNGFSYIYSEYIERKNLPDIYNISDIFVSASLQDVGPYTIAESLLCETPVVSFNTGYANDFVTDKTGVLVNDNTSLALADGIEKILSFEKSDFDKMKKEGRKLVIKKASDEKQIRNYKKLINSLLNE